jgi:hypothetical protein
MRRVAAALSVALAVQLAAGQEISRPKLPPGVPEIVPDPDWEPRVGGRATVLNEVAATTAAGDTMKLEKGAEVQVTRYSPLPRTSRTMSTGAYLDALQNAGPREPVRAWVRVTSGPLKDKEVGVLDTDLGVLIPNPRPWLDFKPGDVMTPWDAGVPLAADLATYFAMKRDPKSVTRLITRGKAFRLKEGDRVSVVDVFAEPYGRPGFEVARVRVMARGPHMGKVAYAFRGNLIRPGH